MNQQCGNSVTVKRYLLAIVTVLTILAMPVTRLNAQSTFGSIVGTVTDSTGAIVANATVTLINTGTNASQTATAGTTGEYRFVNLVPANYKLSIEAANYKKFVRQPISVEVGKTTRIDAAMEVGATTETVEVTAQAPLLETDSGTLGSQVEGTTVTEMPLNGRNPMNLMALAAGVVPGNNTQGGPAMNNGPGNNSHTTATWNNYIIGGGLGGMNAEYFDGVTMDSLGNAPSLVPTQDAVQEFKMATSSVSAEYGHFSGGVMTLASKSGSNQWHGSAYEYVRNKVFNANNTISNGMRGLNARPKWNQNQFGVVASGPALKNKLFFFFSWEHFVARLGLSQVTNTPDANFKAGIIPDPTGAISSNALALSLCPTGMTNNGVSTTIAPSCWDKASTAFIKAYPTGTTVVPNVNNWVVTPVVGNSQNQYNARVDLTQGNQRYFAHWAFWPLEDMPMDVYNSAGGVKTGNGFTKSSSHMAVVGDTITINPTTIADIRVGFMRFNMSAMPQNGGHIDQTQKAFWDSFGPNWAALGPQMTYIENPGFHIGHGGGAGKWGFADFWPMDDTNATHYNSYSIAASLTKIIGSHTMKAGMELRKLEQTQLGLNSMDPSGSFNISKNAIPDEWAAFLLGYADSGQITTTTSVGSYQVSEGFYLTDDWNVNHKLTVNLGLRWDQPGGVSEKHDRATVLLPQAKDPFTGLTGTLALVNNPNGLYNYRTAQKPSYSQFQPRVGFAYRLSNNTTLRGGYGLVYTPLNISQGGGGNPTGSPVNSATTSWTNSPSSPILLYNPFPTSLYPNGINQPVGRKPDFMLSYVNQGRLASISGPIPTEAYSYAQQWNLAVGQQLKGNLMIEASYVGSLGTHLPTSATWGINQLASKYWTTPSQSLRPFAAFQNVTNTLVNHSSSTYHSLQTRMEKRFKGGGLISGNYTWSKGISDSSVFNNGSAAPQDYNNMKAERSVVSSNIPNRAIISYVLPLPFGKGQAWASGVHGVAGGLISGWAVNGITTFQSGWPLAILSDNNQLAQNYGGGTIRPNYIPGCNKSVSGSRYDRAKANKWFNTDCFVGTGSSKVVGGVTYYGPAASLGSSITATNQPVGNQVKLDDKLRQDGTVNWDITLAKTTTIHDKMNVVFKTEFFNAFNRAQYQTPGNVTSYSRNNGFFGNVNNAAFPRLIQFSLRVNY